MQARLTEDERFPAWKIAFLQCLVTAVFAVMVFGYWRIQIGKHGYYRELADRNRIRTLPIIAPRGRILDREGRVLVDNSPSFSILLTRDNPGAITADRLIAMARGIGIDPADLQELANRTAHLPRFQPVVIKAAATLDDVAFVESHRFEYPDLDIIQAQQRTYPYRTLAAPVLGYVGAVDEEQIAESGSRYRPGDVVGKFGIEREYNAVLCGRDGMRRVVVNSRGQEVGTMDSVEGQAGNDLRLTLDLDLETAAENALAEYPGAVVALSPQTGEVLAMVSHPDFDPNDFVHGINRETWQRLTSDPGHPLMNKAIQAHLAPGSIFKIVTGAAALESNLVDSSYALYCPGEATFYGHVYHDHSRHGHVDLHRAIVASCDVYFYTLGKMLGIDRLAFFAKGLGFGARTGIDLPAEDPGLIPSKEWAARAYRRRWWAGETISVSIGQGAVAVTPLQVANTIGGIVSGGVFHRPHLALGNQTHALQVSMPAQEHSFPLKQETVECLSRGMWGVVNEGGGTAGAARDAMLDIAGKTGTAQVVSAALRKSEGHGSFRNNAWFVGYAPSTKPEIVVAVLVMAGDESRVAVPLAHEVIRSYYEKKWHSVPPAGETHAELLDFSHPAAVLH
jgi:penicillin-binding protein 2